MAVQVVQTANHGEMNETTDLVRDQKNEEKEEETMMGENKKFPSAPP